MSTQKVQFKIMNKFTKQQIIDSLISLGVKQGDVLFLAADLLRVGYFSKNRSQTLSDWIDILLACVGNSGTLIIPSYTKTFKRFKKNNNIIFSNTVDSSSGPLSQAILNHPSSYRSSHPTNSCVGIGKYAEYILQDHDVNSTSYYPYGKIVELGGKNLMIGALNSKHLSPMAIHYAQEVLGLTNKHYLSNILQTYYIGNDGSKHLFTRKGVGGCTAGGYKSYGHHIINDALNIGFVGNSKSALIPCRESFNIFYQIYMCDKKLLACDDPMCPTCQGSPIHFNLFFWMKFLVNKVFRLRS